MNTDNKKYSKGVCLLSGGMDSCVTAAVAVEECEEVLFLHVSYGQRTADKEMDCFKKICDYYNVPGENRIPATLPVLNTFGGSTLLVSSSEPVAMNIAETDEIPDTYVPFRNGTLLALAAGLAEARGGGAVYIGAVEEDSSGYPDCRKQFFIQYEKAIAQGTRPETSIEIRTPVIDMNKKDIILLAQKIKAPIEYSWSCYTSQEKACGECDSCKLRLSAFKRAGTEDPIPYMEKDRI